MTGGMADLLAAHQWVRRGCACGWDERGHAAHQAAVLTAAGYGDTRALLLDARLDAVREARGVITQYLSTAEEWRYARVCWAFAIMLNEIPEDSPCPESVADLRALLARHTPEEQ